MATPLDNGLFEERWTSWLVERNRLGANIAFWLTIVIYPLFGILDWLVVPREWWPLIFTTRGVVVAWAIFHKASLNTSWFRRHWRLYTSTHALVLAGGIIVMVIPLGGFPSNYYAGINLTQVGVGLLFVWTWTQASITYTIIFLGYLVACAVVATGPADWYAGAPNLFFLGSTAAVVTAAHGFVRKAARQQLLDQITLERTKSSLEQAHQNLMQLDRFKNQFFANITHELKTPLAMILSPLELMQSGDMGRFTDEQSATIQTMFRNGMKLLKLIQDLLDLSRLEESRIRLRVHEADLVAYLRGLTASVQPLAQRKGVLMTFESDAGTAMVCYDQDRLERVFVNLLSNAAKFTGEGGSIRVSLRDFPDHVVASVADDGPGFPPDKAEKIFERFYQVDMAGTRRFGGTGIGLALARDLVRLHGGRIWAEAEEGKGATFHVQLFKGRDHFPPDSLDRRAGRRDVVTGKRGEDRGIMDWSVQLATRDDYRLLDIAEVTERRIVERDADEGTRPYTVLIVEDTPDIIRLVHMALRQQFRILAAEDGLKGLEIARRLRPDLVITDYMMPGIDGMELARRLRQEPGLKTVPIVMLTARGDVEDRVAGMEAGVNLYLTKPFHPRELLSSVRTLLDIRETQADALMNQSVDSLEKVASGLAHEINNPLNYIKNAVLQARSDMGKALGLATAARERPLTPEEAKALEVAEARSRRMLDTAEAGVRRISGTVDLMRKYARSGYPREVVPYDVFQAVREVVDIVLPATGRAVRVEPDLAGKALVSCVPEEFNQVLTNLVQNAIEACPEGTGLVQVIGRVEGRQVVLRVRDNGPGIPREVRERIFTPFFTTKGPGKGMGLGLTIAWRVVHALGGTIEAGGEEGSGAEFTVRVPLEGERVVAEAAAGGRA